MSEEINNLKGIFANVNDDMLLRDCGNLYAENKQLQQENQQLKFQLEYEKENLMFSKDYAKCLEDKRDRYKSVLDEIREYIEEFVVYSDEDGEIYFKEEFWNEYNNLLQILDKVKE